ncbi:hypothetical protein HT031_004532 [Scenedesmus sp. PABB004]|nr:hypothetical protein HT031_004532 [Scenedesmus sp. PABB004]
MAVGTAPARRLRGTDTGGAARAARAVTLLLLVASAAAQGCGSEAPARYRAGVSVVVLRGACSALDAGELGARLSAWLQALPGVQGNVSQIAGSVQLGDCASTSSTARYSWALSARACPGSAAARLLTAPTLSCTDFAVGEPGTRLCDPLAVAEPPATVVNATRLQRAPSPMPRELAAAPRAGPSHDGATCMRAAACVRSSPPPRRPRTGAVPTVTGSLDVPVTWLQMLGASPIRIAAYARQEDVARFRRTSWAIIGMQLTGPAAPFIDVIMPSSSDVATAQIVVSPVPLPTRRLDFTLELAYLQGGNVSVNGSLQVVTKGIQLPAAPVQVKTGAVFMLNQRQVSAIDVRKLLRNADGLNVQAASFGQPAYGTVSLQRNGDLLYTLDPSRVPVGRSRLWDQFVVELRVLPGGVLANNATQPHLSDASLYLSVLATVDGPLGVAPRAAVDRTSAALVPAAASVAGQDEVCQKYYEQPDDPCPPSGGKLPVAPVQQFKAFAFADFNGDTLTIMAAEAVTLTSDPDKTDAYLVPACLNLEVYADSITIDRGLNITGPRTVKLFARELRCEGADVCDLSTRGFRGLSFSGGGAATRQAPAGSPGQKQGVDNKGSGKDSPAGGPGAPGCKARAGGSGGAVQLFAADMDLRLWDGGKSVATSVRVRVDGGAGGGGQMGGDGGEGGGVMPPDQNQCKSHWCWLQDPKSDTPGYGCHAGNAGDGGAAGASGANEAGGDAGAVSVAAPVPADVAAALKKSAGAGDWRKQLAKELAASAAGGKGGVQAAGGRGGKAGSGSNDCWTTEGLWAKSAWYSGSGRTFRCGYNWEIEHGNKGYVRFDGVNNPSNCKAGTYNGKDAAPAAPGADGKPAALDASAVDEAPGCDPDQEQLQGTTCPLLSPATAPAFRAAANLDQLSMMLNKGTLAFQSGDYGLAGRLTKWVYETAPCFDANPDASTAPACVMQKQARDISAFVVYGMGSRGSSLVLTPRSSLQLIQSYMCLQLLPSLERLEVEYTKVYDTTLPVADRERALRSALDQYEQFTSGGAGQRKQLEGDIASTEKTVASLFKQRESAFVGLQSAEYVFTNAIAKLEADKRHWSFGGLLAAIGSAVPMVGALAGTIGLVQGAFSGGLLERGFAITTLLSTGGGLTDIFHTFDKVNDPNKAVTKPTDITKIAVGSEEWTQMIEPYMDLPIAANYSSLLTTYSGLCDSYNKALVQLEGFRLQLAQTTSEELAAQVQLANVTTELAKAKAKNLNAAPLLDAVRNAYTTVQKRVLDGLYQQALALAYIRLEELKYTPPTRLDAQGMRTAAEQLNQQIADFLSQGVLEQQNILEVDITDEQVDGISFALQTDDQVSIYLPAQSLLSGIKAQVVANRVEAYVLGARAERVGAMSSVRLVHTGHAEFLNTTGQLFSFRSQALEAINADTVYSDPADLTRGTAVTTTGNLRSLNKGAFGARCQSLTIADDNNLLLPVSPFSVWLVDVPRVPGVNTDMNFEGAYGLRLRFFVRHRTQQRPGSGAALAAGGVRQALHPAWAKAMRFVDA